MKRFYKNQLYKLVDPVGMINDLHLTQLSLVNLIMRAGGTIVPLSIFEPFGSVGDIQLGDRTHYTVCLHYSLAKYFEPVDPIAVAACMPLPKRYDTAEAVIDNIIQFPSKNKKTTYDATKWDEFNLNRSSVLIARMSA